MVTNAVRTLSLKSETLDSVIAELERNIQALESSYRKAVSNLNWLKERAASDDLTHLLRRGAFMDKLDNLLKLSQADGQEVNVIMIDIDHFKKVNDSYGHQTGDVVLERVSELIRNYLRPSDLAGRYGGEEIIVAVQGSTDDAARIAESIRNAVQKTMMTSRQPDAARFNVTLSLGIASTQPFSYEADVLIQNADAALYDAKRSGRNRVVSATPTVSVEIAMAA